MRRLVRWTLNPLTVLSLLLCVATVATWVRSYIVGDDYRRIDGGWHLTVKQGRGSLSMVRLQYPSNHRGPRSVAPRYKKVAPASSPPVRWSSAGLAGQPTDPGIRSERLWPGIAWEITDGGSVASPAVPAPGNLGGFLGGPIQFPARRYLYLNHWLLAGLFSMLPLIRGVRRLGRRSPSPHQCMDCSYDLTGNVSGVCPECGSEIPKSAAANST